MKITRIAVLVGVQRSSLFYYCHVAPVEYMYTTQEIQTQLFSLKPALLSSPADKEEKTKK